MTKATEPNYWVFSNHAPGKYEDTIWDMDAILQTRRYSLSRSEGNCKKVRPGDIIYMRIYGDAFIGTFIIGGEWEQAPDNPQGHGTFPMGDVELWDRPLPQALVLGELSNKNHRRRIASITRDDAVWIEAAQRTYSKLGFGSADGETVVLEKGLEEAIKPNLAKLGLKLARKAIQQQFSMDYGVGRSDLICTDEQGDLVVLELKRGMTSDETVGQALTYKGWLQENVVADGQQVHAWIVAGDYDERLRLAAKAAGIKLLLVRLG